MSADQVMHIAGGLWGVLGILWLAASFTNKQAARTQAKQSRLLQIGLGVLAYWLMLSSYVPVPILNTRLIPSTPSVLGAGLSLTVAGLAFAAWARLYIGRNWSAAVQVKQSHELITGGPYSLVRHPIYSGLLLAFAGTGLVFGEGRSVAAFILLAGSWWAKLRLEEQFMTQEFGSAYQLYRQRTKALVPWVL